MSEKFTPGPWAYKPIDNKDGERVADAIVSKDGSTVVYDVSDPKDAPLIAAAPELYEALHWALENIQGMLDEDDIPSIVIRDRARAALAKARGETS